MGLKRQNQIVRDAAARRRRAVGQKDIVTSEYKAPEKAEEKESKGDGGKAMGEAIGGLFKKKKKKEEPSVTQKNVQRTRRGGKTMTSE